MDTNIINIKQKNIFKIIYILLEKNIRDGYNFKNVNLGKLSYDKIRIGFFKDVDHEYYNNFIENPVIGNNYKNETIMILFFHKYLKCSKYKNDIYEKYIELCNDIINSKYTNWINIKKVYIIIPNNINIKLDNHNNFINIYYEEDIIEEYRKHNVKIYNKCINNNNRLLLNKSENILVSK